MLAGNRGGSSPPRPRSRCPPPPGDVPVPWPPAILRATPHTDGKFAFVEFFDDTLVATAMKFNRTSLLGRQLLILPGRARQPPHFLARYLPSPQGRMGSSTDMRKVVGGHPPIGEVRW